jgi:dihydrofolate reductase
MPKPIKLIVATDKNGGVGINNQLPWSFRSDMQHFKKVTSQTQNDDKQNAVIMGRKTWESIPSQFKPLPGRLNIVISRQENLDLPEGVLHFSDPIKAIEDIQSNTNIESIFCTGGAQLYTFYLDNNLVSDIYLTLIESAFETDAHLPIDLSEFTQHVNMRQLDFDRNTSNSHTLHFQVHKKQF